MRRRGTVRALSDLRWLVRLYVGMFEGKRVYQAKVVRGDVEDANLVLGRMLRRLSVINNRDVPRCSACGAPDEKRVAQLAVEKMRAKGWHRMGEPVRVAALARFKEARRA